MAWRLAPTLAQLRKEINEAYPLRDKTSDGTLGNAAHAASVSDHNPDSRGVVCAIDIDEDLQGSASTVYPHFNSGQAAKAAFVDVLLRKVRNGELPQLYYIIYERVIYSRTRGFAPKAYTGVNAHDHHVHVSVYHDAKHADSTRPWNIASEESKPVAKPNIVLEAVNEALAAGGESPDYGGGSNDAAQLQRLLGFEGDAVDGYIGDQTRDAVWDWLRKNRPAPQLTAADLEKLGAVVVPKATSR